MYIKGRRWFKDTGDGDLPCGEIYITPIEEKSNGKIYFNKLHIDEKVYSDIILTFESGELKYSNNNEFNEMINELPPNGSILCEFGIGLNPNVKKLYGYPLLDEKMKDTFHIAIGNNSMFGGVNDSPCYIDLVFKGEVNFL